MESKKGVVSRAQPRGADGPSQAELSKGQLTAGVAQALQLSAELRGRTDELNRVLQTIENILIDLDLGVPAWVRMNTTKEEDDYGFDRLLSFEKEAKKWGLFVVTGTQPEYDRIPLLNASRSLRIESAGLVPALIEKMNENVKEETQRVANAVDKGSAIAAALTMGTAPSKAGG